MLVVWEFLEGKLKGSFEIWFPFDDPYDALATESGKRDLSLLTIELSPATNDSVEDTKKSLALVPSSATGTSAGAFLTVAEGCIVGSNGECSRMCLAI